LPGRSSNTPACRADERFTANIDRGAPGLTRYWRDAIAARPDEAAPWAPRGR
jgi:hypothetical protein